MIIKGITNDATVNVYVYDDIPSDYCSTNEYGTECLDMYSLMSENQILVEKDIALDRYAVTQQEIEDMFESVRDKWCPIVNYDGNTTVVDMR